MSAPAHSPAARPSLAELLEQADANFGFSLELVRLVDGLSTYRLRIGDLVWENEADDNDWAYELIAQKKAQRRAAAVVAAGYRPDDGSFEELLAAAKGMLLEWEKLTRYGSPIAKASNQTVNRLVGAIAKAEGREP